MTMMTPYGVFRGERVNHRLAQENKHQFLLGASAICSSLGLLLVWVRVTKLRMRTRSTLHVMLSKAGAAREGHITIAVCRKLDRLRHTVQTSVHSTRHRLDQDGSRELRGARVRTSVSVACTYLCGMPCVRRGVFV